MSFISILAAKTGNRALVLAAVISLLVAGHASAATLYYNNSAGDAEWTNPANWWLDQAFTVHGSVPGPSDDVFIQAEVDTNSTDPAIVNSADFSNHAIWDGQGNGLTIVAPNGIKVHDTSLMDYGFLTGNTAFYDASINSASVNGNATFNGSSASSGYGFGTGFVSGDAIFNDRATNGGTVAGNAVFNDVSVETDSGNVNGNAVFNNESIDYVGWYGLVQGTSTLNDLSSTVNNSQPNPGGPVVYNNIGHKGTDPNSDPMFSGSDGPLIVNGTTVTLNPSNKSYSSVSITNHGILNIVGSGNWMTIGDKGDFTVDATSKIQYVGIDSATADITGGSSTSPDGFKLSYTSNWYPGGGNGGGIMCGSSSVLPLDPDETVPGECGTNQAHGNGGGGASTDYFYFTYPTVSQAGSGMNAEPGEYGVTLSGSGNGGAGGTVSSRNGGSPIAVFASEPNYTDGAGGGGGYRGSNGGALYIKIKGNAAISGTIDVSGGNGGNGGNGGAGCDSPAAFGGGGGGGGAGGSGGITVISYLKGSVTGSVVATQGQGGSGGTGGAGGSFTPQAPYPPPCSSGNNPPYYIDGTNGSVGSNGASGVAVMAQVVIPTVSTASTTSTTRVGANLYGSINDDGGYLSTNRGFVYGTSTSYGATTTETGSFDIGSFSDAISSLSCGTTYDYAAYASSTAGISYGQNQSFTTQNCVKPSLTITSATSLSGTGATLGANMTDDGGTSATVRGFAYGLTIAYGATTTHTSSGFSIGSFSENISSLSCGTLYHYRAYAANQVGTSTSADNTFVTASCAAPASGGGVSSGSSSSGPVSSTVLAGLLAPSPAASLYLSTRKIGASSAPALSSALFDKSLSVGSQDISVKNLQKYLDTHGFAVSAAGPGSLGHETMIFGARTKIALARFQKAHGISSTGYFGPVTRSYVEAHP